MENPEKTVFYLCDPKLNVECNASINGECKSPFGCKATLKIECAMLDGQGDPIPFKPDPTPAKPETEYFYLKKIEEAIDLKMEEQYNRILEEHKEQHHRRIMTILYAIWFITWLLMFLRVIHMI